MLLPASTSSTDVFLLLEQITEDITEKFYETVKVWALIITSSYFQNVTGRTA